MVQGSQIDIVQKPGEITNVPPGARVNAMISGYDPGRSTGSLRPTVGTVQFWSKICIMASINDKEYMEPISN